MLSVSEFPPKEFSSEPLSQNASPEGSAKVISCLTNSFPRPTYRWMKDNQYITNYSDNYSHRIMSVKRADDGIYRCVANNSLGAIRSNGAHIEIACKLHLC